MTIETGTQAPDFTLTDEDGNAVTLSSFRGKQSVTLVFFPFAFSGVCQGELCELRDNLSSFSNHENQVLAISCDRKQTLLAWKTQQGFDFPMLSDGWPHGAVATAYGCFNDVVGAAERLTVVIDTNGVVTDAFQSGGLGEARGLASYTAALAKL